MSTPACAQWTLDVAKSVRSTFAQLRAPDYELDGREDIVGYGVLPADVSARVTAEVLSEVIAPAVSQLDAQRGRGPAASRRA